MIERLALGTVQFGMPYGVANTTGQVAPGDVAGILRIARAAGVDTLDTAIAYGDSERRLGDVGAGDWRVVTKLPPAPAQPRDISQWVAEAVAGSLERLRLPRVHGLLLHRASDLLEPFGAELYEAMRNARERGLVGRIGVSVYGPEDLEAVVPRFAVDLVQAPFNVIDRRLSSSGWLQRLHDDGVEVHARSAFLQGLLLMEPSRRPPRFERWSGLLQRWDAWRASTGLSPVAACLAFVASHAAIDRVVVGVDSAAQLKEILNAARTNDAAAPDELESGDLDLINPARWRTE